MFCGLDPSPSALHADGLVAFSRGEAGVLVWYDMSRIGKVFL